MKKILLVFIIFLICFIQVHIVNAASIKGIGKTLNDLKPKAKSAEEYIRKIKIPENMILSHNMMIQGQFVDPKQYMPGVTTPLNITEAQRYQFFWGGKYTLGGKEGTYEIIGDRMILMPFHRWDGVEEGDKTVEFSNKIMRYDFGEEFVEYTFVGEMLKAGQFAKCNYCNKQGRKCSDIKGTELGAYNGWSYRYEIEDHLRVIALNQWNEESKKVFQQQNLINTLLNRVEANTPVRKGTKR